MSQPADKSELSDFLRSRRSRLTPAEVGLAPGGRRRTPGLRREEVAELAGISIDWYTRLEQGRDVQPSVPTVEAIGRALRLSDAEKAHLHRLARTFRQVPFERERVPPALQRLLTALPLPGYVVGQRWDLLAWNDAASALFMDFAVLPPTDRNILVYMLTDPAVRYLFGAGWTREARRMLGQFRADYANWVGDPAFEALIANLQARCAQFRGWWQAHEVQPQRAGEKLLHHPDRGKLSVEYATFQSNDDRRLKLVLYRVADVVQ
jgi:transcriptional regulator with XRE-family HTH domain